VDVGCTPEQVNAWVLMLRANQLVADHLESAVREAAGLTLAEHEVLVLVQARAARRGWATSRQV
jgi:hypothetical protein